MSQTSLSPSGAVLSAEMAEQVAQGRRPRRRGVDAAGSRPAGGGARNRFAETAASTRVGGAGAGARRSLDECLTQGRHIPPHLAGLIVAARRTGDFGNTIAQWSENRRAARQHWRSVVASLSYPIFAPLLASGVFLFFGVLVVPVFRRMYEEFGLRLPVHTHMTFWACDAGSRIILSAALVAVAAAIALRFIGGRAGWSLVVTSLPIIGLPWHWTGVAEMLRCLGLFLEHQIPLPEALRLAGGSVSDGYIAAQCQSLAGRVEKGASLTMSLIQLRTLPLSIVPLIHWGERQARRPRRCGQRPK